MSTDLPVATIMKLDFPVPVWPIKAIIIGFGDGSSIDFWGDSLVGFSDDSLFELVSTLVSVAEEDMLEEMICASKIWLGR